MDIDTFSQTVQDYPVSKLQAQLARPHIVVLAGVDKGKIFLLKEGRNIFGRSLQADITLRDHKMSRSHGVFELKSEDTICEDLGSTNGTFIDGHPIKSIQLNTSHRIYIGDTILKMALLTDEEVQAQRDIEAAATIDPLTSVYNRNGFDAIAKLDLDKMLHKKQMCSISILDIDFFKKLNDEFGHAAGDIALVEFSRRVKSQLRDDDRMMRYGGEEFVVMLSNTSQDAAVLIAERIRLCVAEKPFDLNNTTKNITVSIGVYTVLPLNNHDVTSYIKLADEALYKAKKLGRNRVEVYK